MPNKTTIKTLRTGDVVRKEFTDHTGYKTSDTIRVTGIYAKGVWNGVVIKSNNPNKVGVKVHVQLNTYNATVTLISKG